MKIHVCASATALLEYVASISAANFGVQGRLAVEEAVSQVQNYAGSTSTPCEVGGEGSECTRTMNDALNDALKASVKAVEKTPM